MSLMIDSLIKTSLPHVPPLFVLFKNKFMFLESIFTIYSFFFRTSQAYATDQYYLLSNLFSPQPSHNHSYGRMHDISMVSHSNQSESRTTYDTDLMAKDDTSDLFLDDLYRRAGHQLADLVVR